MLEVTKQRPMNNEWVQIHELANCRVDLNSIEGWHFKTLRQILINVANKKPRGQPSNIL